MNLIIGKAVLLREEIEAEVVDYFDGAGFRYSEKKEGTAHQE
jgi:hypothetical protein